jgi:hypothetical protein
MNVGVARDPGSPKFSFPRQIWYARPLMPPDFSGDDPSAGFPSNRGLVKASVYTVVVPYGGIGAG